MRRHAALAAVVGICVAAGAATPGAAATPTPRPNILLAIADDWSFGHAGAYGCGWVKTPGFDRVAKEGLLFRRAYTPNAKCAPSRACILTGRNSWQLKDACNHICFFPAEFKSYGEALQDAGYSVGTTGKAWGPGVARDAEGALRQMAGKPYQSRKAAPPAKEISNVDYAANFDDFLRDTPAGRPWCFWYGALEPHRAYEYGVGVGRGGKQLGDVDRVPGYWPDNEQVRHDILDYAYEVEHFDAHLRRILLAIEQRGELENTLVVVTSDHGMPFPRCKGQAYEASNHVPLAVMWPRGIRGAGRTVDDYVSFVDLAPTFLEAAGVPWAEGGMQPAAGASLSDVFRSDRSGQVVAERNHVLVGKERHDVGRPHDWGYPIRGIFLDNTLYVRNFETDRWPACDPVTGYLNCDGGPTKTRVLESRAARELPFWQLCFGKRPSEELYDVARDPDCLVNLAADPGWKKRKQELEQQMMAELRRQGDPRMEGRGDDFDKIPYANPGTRNFYERYLQGEKIRAGWVSPSDFQKD